VALPFWFTIRNAWPQVFFENSRRNPAAKALRRAHKTELAKLPAILVVLNLITMIYLMVGLFGAETFRERQGRVLVLLVGSMSLLWLAKKLFGPLSARRTAFLTRRSRQSFNTVNPFTPEQISDRAYDELFWARSLVFMLAVAWDFVLCYRLSLFGVLVEGLPYAVLMIVVAQRFVRLDTQLRYEGSPSLPTKITQASILLATYIVGCLSYMVTIYPHISANFGGGDFTKSSDEVVCISGAIVPDELMADKNCTKPVKVIHETEEMVYVAPSFITAAGMYLRDSRESGSIDRAYLWQTWSPHSLPSIYGIARKNISSMNDSSVAVNERSIDAPARRYYSSGATSDK